MAVKVEVSFCQPCRDIAATHFSPVPVLRQADRISLELAVPLRLHSHGEEDQACLRWSQPEARAVILRGTFHSLAGKTVWYRLSSMCFWNSVEKKKKKYLKPTYAWENVKSHSASLGIKGSEGVHENLLCWVSFPSLDADPVFRGGPPSRWFNQTGVKGVVEIEVGQRALHAYLEQWVFLQSAQESNSVQAASAVCDGATGLLAETG